MMTRYQISLAGLAVLFCFSLLSGQTVFGQQAIGSVVALEGEAVAVRSSGMEEELGSGADVFLNDRILTRRRSRITIRFLDESTLSQGENSEMVLNEFVFNPARKKDNAFQVRMIQGAFRCITGKIVEMNPARFGLRTGKMTIGIRGTDIGIEINPYTGEENLLVFDLHRRELEVAPGVAGLEPFVVTTPFVQFQVTEKGVEQRALTQAEAKRFIKKSAPKGAPPPGGPTPASGVKMDMPPWLENR